MVDGAREEAAAQLGWRHFAAVALVLIGQYSLIGTRNFGETDDWVVLSLASRGVTGLPYANRPLMLLWSVPAALLPLSFETFYILNALYLLIAGWAVLVLIHRLTGATTVAVLAGMFTTFWAPADGSRLITAWGTTMNGPNAAVWVALLLLCESARVGKPLGLLAAGAAALAAIRSYEATLPLLAAGPIVYAWFLPRERRLFGWAAGWAAVIAVGAALVFWPALTGATAEVGYQASMGLDVRPSAVLGRLARYLSAHVVPAVQPWRGPYGAAALRGALACAAGWVVAFGLRPPAAPPLIVLGRLAAAGLLWAGLAYAPYTLSGAFPTFARLQFFSTPGVSVLLAASVHLLARALPSYRAAAVAALGVWVSANGAARVARLQAAYDAGLNYFPAQDRLLGQLVSFAPQLRRGTLVVLMDGVATFPASFSFHHAVRTLYEGRAGGFAWGAADAEANMLYRVHFTPEGVYHVPWTMIARAWDERPHRYAYHELFIVRAQAQELIAMTNWPPELPPLPAGAEYSPGDRILHGETPATARRLLGPPR